MGDHGLRSAQTPGGTISELATEEHLLALPAVAFPAVLEVKRIVSRIALVSFEGNRYSVPPGLVGQSVTVRARLGELHLEIVSPLAAAWHAIAVLSPVPARFCRAQSTSAS